jgi:rhodanese-related sulfurtransferase
VNVQFADVANPGVVAVLPLDRPILVICYTGHTASIANAFLGGLGYDAWTLRFGMTSWKAVSPTAVWSASVKQSIAGGNYPVVTGSTP